MRFLRRRNLIAPDKEALSKILADDPPQLAGAVPLTISFGRVPLITMVMAFVVGGAVFAAGDILSGDYLFAALLGSALAIIHLSAIFSDPTLMDVSVTVTGEGIRQKKWFGEKVISWWDKPDVTATPDITRVYVASGARTMKINLSRRPTDSRVEFVQSIRSWVKQYGYEVDAAEQPSNLRDQALTLVISGVGIALMFSAIYLFGPSGHVLGMRCSVNGAYFQERFDTPNRQGCVVLRVSAGAKNAGVKQGDLLVEMNGVPITSGAQFMTVFDESKPPWHMKLLREGKAIEVTAKSGRRQTFEKDTQDPIYYYLRAREKARDHPVDAIEDYTTAIELEPEFDLAYLYRAELYDEIGSREEASADFLRALELSPTLGEAHRFFARHERDAGNSSAAMFRIRKAIELDNCTGAFEALNVDCNDDYYLLAVLQEGYYDLQEPIANLLQAVRFWPDAPEPYCVLASLLERAGDLPAASNYARKYLDFPEEDRFLICEPEARRIANGITLTPPPTAGPTMMPEATPLATGGENCIDFSSKTSCTPF